MTAGDTTSLKPFDPAPLAMGCLAGLVLASVAVILMVATHCTLLDPADPQCARMWGSTVKDAVLELAPILVALTLRR